MNADVQRATCRVSCACAVKEGLETQKKRQLLDSFSKTKKKRPEGNVGEGG